MATYHQGNSKRLEKLINKIFQRKMTEEKGSLGSEHDSWSSNTPERTSPTSSSCPTPCSNVSDTTPDGDIPFTNGVTENTPYPCRMCSKSFARSSQLSQHQQTHGEKLLHSCVYCTRLFKHKRSRDRHVKLHTGDKKYKCNHCTMAFARSDHLKIHIKTHDNNKPFRCPSCNRGYNTAAALTMHQQSHKSQDNNSIGTGTGGNKKTTAIPGNYMCMYCKDFFPKLDSLQEHIKNKHSPSRGWNIPSPVISMPNLEPKWVCIYCAEDFKTMDDMQVHVNAAHDKIINGNVSHVTQLLASPREEPSAPTYACDNCTMKFDSLDKLRDHVTCVHWKPSLPLRTRSSIDLIDYSPTSPSNHEPPKSSPNSYPIQSAPTDLSRKRKQEDCLELNKTPHHLEDAPLPSQMTTSPYESDKSEEWSIFICNICGTQMPTFGSFMAHMDNHMQGNLQNDNTPVGYCPFCNETCRTQLEMNNHMVAHSVTFKRGRCCRICKKVFNHQIEDLQKHLMEIHTCTTYKCSSCEQLFNNKAAIMIHLTKKHSNECQHYRCNFCPDQIFHDRLAVSMHVSQHLPQIIEPSQRLNHQTFPYPNNELDLRFQGIINNFQCLFCPKMFKNKQLQYLHIFNEHKMLKDVYNSRLIENCFVDSGTVLHQNSPNSPSVAFTSSLSSPENSSKFAQTVLDGYTCEICNSSDFSSESELVSHKKLHQVKSKTGPVSLQCAYCNEHCKSRTDLENHMKSHQINSVKGKHKCNICDEVYSSAITLAEHKLSHCKIVFGISCTQCKAILTDEQAFYSHQVQHSNVPNKTNNQINLPANCIICCQTLQTDIEIKLHANFHLRHLMQKEFLCSICNTIYDSSSGLMKQECEKSSENLHISVCKNCMGKCSSTTNSPMPSSGKPEHENSIYSCIKCPKTFENENDVKQHATSHVLQEGTNHECHLCRTIYPSPLKLQIHVIEHSFLGTGQFRCYICSSVFTTASGLLSHMLEHGSHSKPYECSHCEMKFYFQTELDNHKYNHAVSPQKTRNPLVNGEINDAYLKAKRPKKLKTLCKYCKDTYNSNGSETCSKCTINLAKVENDIKQEASQEPQEASVAQNF